MSLSRWARSSVLSAALLADGCARPPEWQALSESSRLARAASAPVSSPMFDGKTLRLRGARGETLGVEIRASAGVTRTARLEFPEFAAKISRFSVRSLEVREASTDLYGPTEGRGVYPDILEPTEDPGETSDFWYFDAAIPASARPGRYEGRLSVGDRVVPAWITVSRARIDLGAHPLVWVFYAPREIARAHGLTDGDGPELVDKEGEYDALFREHGAYLASDVPPARFEKRRRFVHDVSYWPVAVDTTSDQSISADVSRWLALFQGTGVTPFAIPVDEPHTLLEKTRARHIADVMGSAGAGKQTLLRGVTDVADPIYGDAIDVFISPKNIPRVAARGLRTGEHFWTYNGRPPEAGSMVLDAPGAALRTWGWIAERYDVELWYAWEGLYFSDRYNARTKGEDVATDVTHDPITFDERRHGGTDFGNGDGVLAYPGPLPSLRLKVLRRGLEDRLLLRELEKCGAVETAREIVRSVVPTALGEASGRRPTWPEGEIEWERARGAVLDAIEARCHEDT